MLDIFYVQKHSTKLHITVIESRPKHNFQKDEQIDSSGACRSQVFFLSIMCVTKK